MRPTARGDVRPCQRPPLSALCPPVPQVHRQQPGQLRKVGVEQDEPDERARRGCEALRACCRCGRCAWARACWLPGTGACPVAAQLNRGGRRGIARTPAVEGGCAVAAGHTAAGRRLAPGPKTSPPPLPTAPAAEIVMFDDVVVVYKCLGDLMFYVTGGQDENELILYAVLQAFYESVSILLRCAAPRRGRCMQPSSALGCRAARSGTFAGGRSSSCSFRARRPLPRIFIVRMRAMCPRRQQVDKKTVLENLDLVLLAIDEIVDRGWEGGQAVERTRGERGAGPVQDLHGSGSPPPPGRVLRAVRLPTTPAPMSGSCLAPPAAGSCWRRSPRWWRPASACAARTGTCPWWSRWAARPRRP